MLHAGWIAVRILGGFSGKKKKEETLYYSFLITPGTTYSFKAKEGNQRYIKTKSRF
jgi:hypothetical protein